MLRVPAAGFLLCLLAAAAGAQPAPAPLPRDERVEWQIGFSQLASEGLSAANSYLAGAIPLLLRDSMTRLPWHELSDAERDARRAAIVDREKASLDSAIAARRKTRDAAFFEGPPNGPDAVAAAQKDLAALARRREALAALDPSTVEVASRKGLKIVDGGGPGKLLEQPEGSRSAFCAQRGLDMLVGGSLREVQGFLRLDLWAWDAVRGEEVFSWREAGTREELYESLGEAGRGLVEPVLGSPWASIRAAVTPALASLSIDGTKASPAGSGEIFLAPGTHTLRAEAPGYDEAVREVTLGPGEAMNLEIALERRPAPLVTIETVPPAADVYLNSLWMGRTPLEIDLPAQRGRVMLAREGFNPLAFSLGPGFAPRSPSVLEASTVSRDQAQHRARDAFYAAFGWFLVSLPGPLFCYRSAFDYAAKAQVLVDNGRIDEARTAVGTGTVLYWTSVGGAVVSGSLFAWVVSTIIRYVAVSDRAAG